MALAQATAEWYERVGVDDTLQQLQRKWTECLLLKGESDPCESALTELSQYFGIDRAEARRRCENWEQESIKEWERSNRESLEGLLDFYRTTESWIFDTVWYHAKQCSGEQFPESVAIANGLRHVNPGQLLDLGAGPGSTGLYFHELGWEVSLADISTTLQTFAKWRFAQRNVQATFYDTSKQELPAHTFDLITAIDVVAHIPDWSAELVRLHRSLKEGGLLVFNVDARPKARENQWHLYQFHYPIIRPIRRVGFQRWPKIEFFYVYRKCSARGAFDLHRSICVVQDAARYNNIVSRVGQVFSSMR